MGSSYIKVALDAVSNQATAAEAGKKDPDLSYLPHLRIAISIVHLMITCRIGTTSSLKHHHMEKRPTSLLTGWKAQKRHRATHRSCRAQSDHQTAGKVRAQRLPATRL